MKSAIKKILEIDIDYKDICKEVFCIAIASKPNVYKDIDKIFNKNKLEYMNYFKNSNVYKSPLSKTLMADVSLYTEKVLGIIEKGLATNDYKDVFDLYKKAHKRLYNSIKSIKTLSLTTIIKTVSPGVEGNYELVSTIYMYSLLVDNEIEQKAMEDKILDYMKVILDEYIQLSYYDKTNFSKQNIDTFSPQIKEIREYLGLQKRSYTGEEILDLILAKDTQRYNASKLLTPFEMINPITSNMHKIEKIGEVGKYVGSYEGVFKYLKINSAELMKMTSFNQSEINSIILNYIYSSMFNNFEEKDRNMFLISNIYLAALNKAYSNLKDKYLKALNEDFVEEIHKLQNNLEKSINEAKKSAESFKQKESSLLEKEKQLLDRINQLEKENKRLNKEVEESKSLKQEVIKLRNLVFDESVYSNIQNDEQSEFEINIENLNSDKVIIFGGDTSWINNMREKLPNARFVSGDYKNIKLDFIKKDSTVFINTRISHAFYYKIKDALIKTNIDYYYINSSSNINNSLIDMNKALESNK